MVVSVSSFALAISAYVGCMRSSRRSPSLFAVMSMRPDRASALAQYHCSFHTAARACASPPACWTVRRPRRADDGGGRRRHNPAFNTQAYRTGTTLTVQGVHVTIRASGCEPDANENSRRLRFALCVVWSTLPANPRGRGRFALAISIRAARDAVTATVVRLA